MSGVCNLTKTVPCWGLLLCVILAAAGCGPAPPQLVPVSGTVLLDNAPLSSGVVTFISDDGIVASAPLSDDGSFRLRSQYGDGIPQSVYRVAILPQMDDPSALEMQGPAPRGLSVIPIKYQDIATSDLTANSGEQSEYTFRLVSQAGL